MYSICNELLIIIVLSDSMHWIVDKIYEIIDRIIVIILWLI